MCRRCNYIANEYEISDKLRAAEGASGQGRTREAKELGDGKAGLN